MGWLIKIFVQFALEDEDYQKNASLTHLLSFNCENKPSASKGFYHPKISSLTFLNKAKRSVVRNTSLFQSRVYPTDDFFTLFRDSPTCSDTPLQHHF